MVKEKRTLIYMLKHAKLPNSCHTEPKITLCSFKEAFFRLRILIFWQNYTTMSLGNTNTTVIEAGTPFETGAFGENCIFFGNLGSACLRIMTG